jgi:hypothetical protein
MDIKIAGQIDFTNFMKDIKSAKNQDPPIDSAPAIINRNVNLVVVYASNNAVIAKAEAYLKNEQVESQECGYNKDMVWSCNTVLKPDTTIDVHMIFADGTKSDFETYFNDGFDKVIESFNTFIDELNTTYNWNVAHVTKKN